MGTLASGSIDLKSLKVAGEGATSYITAIDNNGIKVHAANNIDLNYTQITSDGMEVFKTDGAESNPSAVSIANFGEIVRIGKQDDNYFWIDNNGIYLKNNGFSIFQIFSETLDNNINIEQILYNKKSYLGWKRRQQSQYTYQYEPNSIQFTFDDGILSMGDSFVLSLFYDGCFSYQRPNSGTWYTYYITDEEVLQNFTYGVSKKVWIAASQGSSTADMFYIQYNGTNQFNFLSLTNISSAWPETNEKHIRVSYYKNIKVYFESQISSLPTVMVGPQELSHAEIDYHSFQMIDKEQNSYFHISDLRKWENIEGNDILVATITENVRMNNSQHLDRIQLQNPIYQIVEVTINNIITTEVHFSGYVLYFDTSVTSGDKIQVTYKTLSDKTKAFTFGSRTDSSSIGIYSTAMGYDVTANGAYSHAEGQGTTASNSFSHAEGWGTAANGDASHAEGYQTGAIQSYSHAEGDNTVASGISSHAEGEYTTAYGDTSHAEGQYTEAIGKQSHAEGWGTAARANNSHAEGNGTTASGSNSHAEGYNSIASGSTSHAGGCGTVAQGYCQTVIGHYNIPQSSSPVVDTDHAFIIGNGTDSNTLSNALTVDWSGNLELAGSLKTNRNVLSDSKTISITATGQTLNFCSLTLPANSKFLILTTVYTNRGTNLTLINHITCTNNATMVGANTRVTTSSGQGLANWYYVVTNDSSSVATLHGYSYPDGGTGYNQSGHMVAIPL